MHRRFSIVLRLGLLIVFVAGSFLQSQPAKAGIVAGYSEYFIPGSAAQLFAVLTDNDSGISGTTLHNVITVSLATDNVKIYYDHWENGYGNGVTGNDETYTANRGTVLTFVSDVAGSGHSGMDACAGSTFPAGGSGGAATHCYDGQDRLYIVGGAVSVAQAFWPTSTGTVYAHAWEVYPVKPYQQQYTIPVGENLYQFGGSLTNYPDFETAYVLIQSTKDGTILNVDNKNPSPSRPAANDIVNLSMSKGQVTQVYDIWAGTTVTASEPVQVQFIVGNQNAGFDSRSHTAVPTGLWDTQYYSPVPGFGSTNVNLYVYNPTASSLTITYQDTSGSGSFVLPANSTRSYREMAGRYVPAGSGVYLAAADGTTKFWAIGEYDSGASARNWGFSLIPAKTLTSEYIVSWAPGTSEPSPGSNGSPVYISPTQNNTTVFVDYSPADGVADATFTLNRLQVQKVRDTDHVNTGMRVWATAPFTIVWGEDAEYAGTGNPYIDAGYTILPLNQDWVDVVLSLDKTSNPTSISAAVGQAVSFTLAVDSTYPMSAVDLIDDLPTGWAYINDSTTITLPDGTTISGASANPTISGQNLTWSNVGNSVGKPGMNAGETLTLTFQAQTIAVPGNYSINSGTVTATSAGETFTATDTATVVATAPDLTVTKTNNLSGNALIGSPFTWTLQVANGSSSGLATFADGQTILIDNLPSEATYGAVSVTNGAILPTGPLGCSITGTVLTCTANGGAVTFPTGASFSLVFDVTPSAAGALNNPTGGVCAVDPNNVVDEGTNEGNNSCSNNVTVVASALSVVKNSSAAGTVNFGDTITYTIEIENVGGSTLNDIVVTDALPAGTSYVANTTQVTGWLESTYTYRDTFNPASYSNSNQGTATWSGSWTETGDNNSAASGLISINNNRLRFNDSDSAMIERTVDLSNTSSAILTFDWSRVGGDESIRAELWNGTGWDTVGSTNTSGASSGTISHTLTNVQRSATGILRFSSNTGGWSAGEIVDIDNVQFEFDVTSPTTTIKDNVPGGVNADLTSGNPSMLVTGADAFVLDPGDTMTVTYQVLVDNLAVGQTSVVNTVSVKSEEQPQPLDATTTDNLPNSTVSGQVRKDVDQDGTTGGIADANDSGLAGATVTLYTDPNQDGDPADGVQVGSPFVTDVTGNYAFTNLPSGYYVVVETDPASVSSVMDKDGDTTAPGYNEIPVVLLAGSNNSGNSFLDVSTSGILSGSILTDTDNDNTGDAPLAGVTLTLYTDPNADGDIADGALVAFDVDPTTPGVQSSVLSQADGSYTFVDVLAGSYVIVKTQPAGYLNLSQGDTTADVPVNPADAGTTTNRIPVNLAAGETDDGNIFVEEQLGTLTGHVYYDRNADGSQDLDGANNIPGDADDEVDLSNVAVLITPSSGVPFTVSTNASGDWTADVTPGSTTINVDETDPDFTGVVPAGFSPTEGTDPQTVAASAGVTTPTGNDGYGEYIPGANDDTPADVAEDSGTTNIPVLGNDSFGGDGPSTGTISITSGPGAAVGTATVNHGGTANDPTDDTIDFSPAANYNGPVSITYEICDADGDCDSAVVSFNVTPLDDQPVANDDSFTTAEDTSLNSDLKPANGSSADVSSGDGGNVWSKLTDPAHGTVTVNTDGTFTYTPAANYNGTDSFTYEICDVDGDCDPATVSITINTADDPVAADNESYTTPEDTLLTVNAASGVLPGDSYPDGLGSLTVTTNVSHGTLTLNTADGTFTYLPEPDYSGTDSFQYQICDADSSAQLPADCSTGMVDITINGVDDMPVANDDSFTTPEDTSLNDDLKPNNGAGADVPSGDGGNVWSKLTNPAHGTVTVNADGTFTYNPTANYTGTDSFTYQICDVDNDCEPATVNITITSVNDTPLAEDDINTTAEDTPVPGDVTPNDTLSGDGGNTWNKLTDPAHGTLLFNADGTYTYTPDANFNGTDSFDYEICDVDGDCDPATVDITIAPADDPVTVDNESYVTPEDILLAVNGAIGILPGDNYPDGLGALTITTDVSHGSLTLNTSDGSFTYLPASNYYGTDSFEYQICDADSGAQLPVDCAVGTVDVTITSVDDVPVANNDSFTTSEDTPLASDLKPDQGAGVDVPSGDGGNVWSKLTDPAHGMVTVNANGTFTYTPTANYSGPDSFTYQICDADNDCDPATVNLTIDPLDDLPVAENDSFTTGEEITLNGDLKPNNGTGVDAPSGDGGNVWSKLTDPAHGAVTVNADGTFNYVPAANYNGSDSFTYQICDADGDCDPATVNISIDPLDDPVTTDDESYTTPEDIMLSVNAASGIRPGDSYPDGFGTLTLITDVTHGTLTLNIGDGSFTYLPNANYTGSDSFEYQLCDVDGDCDTGRVDITINPVDDAPTADDDNAATNQDMAVTINQLSNDSFGGDGAHVTTPFILPNGVNGLILAAHGTVSLDDQGTPLDPSDDRIVYTPDPGYYGADSFEYRICDADGDCDPATVTINIQGNPGGLSKTILDSNAIATTDPDVAIGEIITYRISVNVPPGVFANAQLVDTLDRGLSFMDCLKITDNGLQTSNPSGFSAICSNPIVDDAGGTTTVDVGRRVIFDFGTLTNNTGADQALLVTYRAVVLDSAGNRSATSLDNSAEWMWQGGSLGPVNDTVVIVEPDLSISTTADTLAASIGSEITITLTIQHMTDSEGNAYDAVVTDTLPPGLQYVPGSLECASGAQDADVLCAEAGGTITAQWSNFALGSGNGQVTFRVTVLSLPPGGITNTANVAWTSLPGDVSSPQNSNVFSTERDYDPASPINIYGNHHALTMSTSTTNGSSNITDVSSRAKLLPSTGFAPNQVTDLSNMPRETYAATNGVTLVIPSLGIKIPVVGVPFKSGDWNVAWLGNEAGWLEGTAFPSWMGNSVITSHVYLSNGLPGPFVNLNQLKYGEKLIVQAYGQKYTFEVRSNEIVAPNNLSAFKHEEQPWLTLVTCKEYDEKTNSYRKRVVVRAVLVSVTAE